MAKKVIRNGIERNAPRNVTQLWKEIGGKNVESLLRMHADGKSLAEVKKFHDDKKDEKAARKEARKKRGKK